MDNNIGDIGAMLARLSENPAALNLISSLMNGSGAGQNGMNNQNMNSYSYSQPSQSQTQSPPFPNQQGGGVDINSLLGMLGNLAGGQGGQGNQNAQSTPVSQQYGSGQNNISGAVSGGDGQHKKPAGIFGSKEDIKNRIALLGAVKPYLSQSRRDMLENIIKLLRLTELGELGSILGRM